MLTTVHEIGIASATPDAELWFIHRRTRWTQACVGRLDIWRVTTKVCKSSPYLHNRALLTQRLRIGNVCFLMLFITSTNHEEVIAEFRNIRLPCNKTLWEADSRLAWEAEYNSCLGKAQPSQPYNLADLINMQHNTATSNSRNLDELDKWNSGLDGLSMLVTMTVAHL